MKRATLVVTVGVCIMTALLATFAIELSATQTHSRNEVKGQVHDRAVLAAALINSLFATVSANGAQDAKTYGTATVSTAAVEAAAQGSAFAAVVTPDGQVLAGSSGFTQEARAGVSTSGVLKVVATSNGYGFGNLSPYGRTGTIDLAVEFATPYGTRVLVTGLTPVTLSRFLSSDLDSIPGVKGADNYLIDGNGVVLASTNPAAPVGLKFSRPDASAVLSRTSSDAGGTYFDEVGLTGSAWRIVLAAPNGPLFASVTGLRELVPWLIFAAFAIVALVALALGARLLRSSDQIAAANRRLEDLNGELTGVNEALGRRAAELARSNEELDQFASIASHDLQEPLRKVRMFTEQLTVLESDRLSEKGRDYLLRANAAAERMQRLIEDLLKFSRVSTQGRAFGPVDLADVARGVLVDLDAQIADSHAEVRVHSLPTITADALQMQQLLQNLISNALKFRRPGVPPEIDVDARIDAGRVSLRVRDNGIGFEPRYSARIFRVFERLHGRSDYPGTGIGLALCRKVADRHGGTIAADSEPGVGSTFTVTLPLVPDGHLAPEAPEAAAPTAPAAPVPERREVRTADV